MTDIVLISAVTAFGAGVGTAIAAGDELVLTPEEQALLKTADKLLMVLSQR